MTNKPGEGFIPPHPAQPADDPLIPVAIPYFSDVGPSMLPLVRVLAVLIVITAALRLISVPTFILGSMRLGSTLGDWYGWYRVIIYFVNVALAAVSLVGAIGCLRNPLSGRRLLIIWAGGSLVFGAASILANAIYIYQRYSRPLSYAIGGVASWADYVVAMSAIPIICLVVLRRQDVKRLFSVASE